MKKIMHFLKLASIVASLLVLASCGGGGGGGGSGSGTQPTTTQAGASLVVAKVDDAASPVIAVMTDNTGKEKIGIIGTKDSSGAPLSATQALYISASGEAGTITIGADGLPASLSDEKGDKITFTNFTDNSMDITQFDPAGNKVAGPVTVNVDPTVLAKLRADAGTLASSSTQGTSLVTGAFLGISTQDWIDLSANDIGIAVGLVGCGGAIISGTTALDNAMCASTLVDSAKTISGTNSPANLTIAGDAAGIAGDCVAKFDVSGCVTDVVLDTVLPIANALAQPPTTPTGLTLSRVQEKQVRFYWTGSSDDYSWITGYSVYRDGNQIADGAGVLYVDQNVIPGTQYCYTVTAHDANGKISGVSDPLCVTIPVATLFVGATTPVSGASAVPISNSVFATFNEAIDVSTLNASTFTVTGLSGLVTGTVSYNAATNSAVFTPTVNPAYAATYTANVTTGVKDLSGNPLASNYSWDFTTASNSGGGTASLGFTNLNP
ncbi:MAG: Ig-like domain-containing domain, partial [Sulfuricella sp.]